MLVDYRAGVDRHDEQRIHLLSPSLFDYTDDVMATRDRPNRFFGHYEIEFPRTTGICDRGRISRKRSIDGLLGSADLHLRTTLGMIILGV